MRAIYGWMLGAAALPALGVLVVFADEESEESVRPDASPASTTISATVDRTPKTYRGIPDPAAFLEFDVWADYTVDRVVTGERDRHRLACDGTIADPCLIDAAGASFEKLTLTGSFLILQGGIVNAPGGRGPWLDASDCTGCVIRDVEVAGPGIDSSHSAAVGLGDRNVWIRGSVHGFGDNRVDAREQDFHGFKVMRSDVWILEAEIYDVSGDSVQVGDASRGSGNRVYLGGGYYHHNRENAVDIKDSSDVVVSGILMEGFRPTGSSPGEALILHDDAVNGRVYDNVIRDASIGIVSSGKSGHIIEGNDIEALRTGMEIRSTKNITVTGNRIDAPRHVLVQGGGVSGEVQRR